MLEWNVNMSKKFKVQLVRSVKKDEFETDEFSEGVIFVSKGCKEIGDTGSVVRVSDGFVMFEKNVVSGK